MLALQKPAPGPGVELREAPEPGAPAPGEVLLHVAAAGICGTDLHIDDWAEGFHFMASGLPVTLGHEFSARVEALGEGVEALSPGDRVVVQPCIGCGDCPDCDSGARHACLRRTAIGTHRPGGFAPRVTAPAGNCIRLPDAVDDELGALIEPLTTGVQAVAIGEVKPGDRVVVFGPGPIGQGTALMARRAGASEVVVVGHGDAARFETLRRMGFDRLVDLALPEGDAKLRELAGAGFDVAIDASGAPAAINQGLSVLRPYGVLVVAGMPDKPASFDVMLLVRGRTQMRGCSRAPDWTWPAAIEAVAADPEPFRAMITRRLPLSAALDGFASARARSDSKVLVLPQAAHE